MSDKLREQSDLGHAAKSLLESKVFEAATGAIEAKVYTAWKKSAPADSEAREQGWLLNWAIDQLKQELTVYVANGKVADQQLATDKDKTDG